MTVNLKLPDGANLLRLFSTILIFGLLAGTIVSAEKHGSMDPELNYRLGDLVIGNDTLRINGQFRQNIVTNLLDSSLEAYKSRGFYYTVLILSDSRLTDSTVDLIYSATLGPVVKISSIEFTGLKRTKPDLLLRQLDCNPGDTLVPSVLDRLYKEIISMDLLAAVDYPKVIADPGYQTARIVVKCQETKSFEIEGNIGYLPEQKDHKLAWYLNLNGSNIFGGGENGKLIVDRRDRNLSLFSVSYSTPAGLVIGDRVSLSAETRDYDSLFNRFELSAEYGIKFKPGFGLGIRLGWSDTRQEASFGRSYDIYKTGLVLHYGNFRRYRGQGSFGLDWSIDYLMRRYDSDDSTLTKSSFDDTRSELRARWLLPVYRSFSFSTRLLANNIESNEDLLPLADLFLFGGPDNLRGYRSNSLTAQRYFVFTPEIDLFFGLTDYFYLFSDLAYFENYRVDNEGEVYKTEDFLSGYGFGFSLASGPNRFSFDLSWSEQTDIDKPMINIVILSRF